MSIQIQAVAQDITQAGDQRIDETSSVQPKSLKNVLAEVEKTFKVSILYNVELVNDKIIKDDNKILSNIEGTLYALLTPFQLQYKKVSDDFFYIVRIGEDKQIDKLESKPVNPYFTTSDLEATLHSNKRPVFLLKNTGEVVVTGHVFGEDKQPLTGVSVAIKTTAIGTITDNSGAFNLIIPNRLSNPTLVLSFMGFNTQEAKINSTAAIDIVLIENISTLSEVIVTGYSQKAKNEISGSVVSLKASEINMVTVNSVNDMLIGKVAGLRIQTPSGQPGSTSDMRIRGVGSIFTNQQPLVVVDGIIGGNYNPNDIASVTVLKDAAATGLYGSRAAAGVIVITTKSGTVGKSDVYVSIRHGIKKPDFGNFRMMNSQQLYDYQKLIMSERAFITTRPASLLENNYNWIDNTYKQSVITTAYLSAAGATEKTNYFLSADLMNDNGTLIGTNYQRLGVRAKVKHSLSDRIDITTNIYGYYEKSRNAHWTLAQGAFRLMPWDNPYDSDGNLVYDKTAAKWISNVKGNPYHSLQYNKYGNQSFQAQGSLFFEYRIFDWLHVTSRNTVGVGNSKFYEVESPLTIEGVEAGGGRIFNNIGMNLSYLSTNLLNFDKSFGDHSIDGLFGVEGSKLTDESNYGGNGIGILPGQEVLGSVGTISGPAGKKEVESYFSILSQINYGFRKKYFITASLRRDGSSKFSPQNKFGNFYNFSAAWLMSEESFLANVYYVSYMKLRASYGAVGNSNFPDGRYPYFPGYDPNSYNQQSAYYAVRPGNYSLSWEVSKPFNAGIDFELFKRVEFNVDYYNTLTKNVLLQMPLPLSQGYKSQWKNAAEIRNEGIEVAASSKVVDWNGLSVRLNFNIARNINTIEKLPQGTDYVVLSASEGGLTQILTPNAAAFNWYMPVWVGVNPDDGRPVWEKMDGQGNKTNTSVYAEATPQSVGSALPKYLGGFGMTVRFKGIYLTSSFSYVYGNKIFNRTRQQLDNDGAQPNLNSMQLQDGWSRWTKPGDVATHPKPMPGGNNNAHENSSRYLEDGSYIRFRNLTVGYELPEKLVSKGKLKLVRISILMDNLKTWTKFSGMDSDVPMYYQLGVLPGTNSFNYPINKQYLLNLEFSF